MKKNLPVLCTRCKKHQCEKSITFGIPDKTGKATLCSVCWCIWTARTMDILLGGKALDYLTYAQRLNAFANPVS